MTAKPRWRDFGDVPKGPQVRQDRAPYMLGIAGIALSKE